jgi:hypothetical protein
VSTLPLSLIAISEWTLLGMSNYGAPGGPTWDFLDNTVDDARSGSGSRTGSPGGGAASGQIYS